MLGPSAYRRIAAWIGKNHFFRSRWPTELDRQLEVVRTAELMNAVTYASGDARYIELEFVLRPEDSIGSWTMGEVRLRLAQSLRHVFVAIDGQQATLHMTPLVSDLSE